MDKTDCKCTIFHNVSTSARSQDKKTRPDEST